MTMLHTHTHTPTHKAETTTALDLLISMHAHVAPVTYIPVVSSPVGVIGDSWARAKALTLSNPMHAAYYAGR